MTRIHLRPPTAEEKAWLQGKKEGILRAFAGILLCSLLCGFVLFAVVSKITGWLGVFEAYSRTIGGVAAFLTFGWMTFRFSRRCRSDAATASEDAQIEEISVSGGRVLELIPLGDVEPVFCFGEDSATPVLLLKGQWIYDSAFYEASPGTLVVEDANFRNGLGGCFAFPAAVFTCTRDPRTGDVFRIKVIGPYVKPEPSIVKVSSSWILRDSEILQGKLSDLEELLNRLSQSQSKSSLPLTA